MPRLADGRETSFPGCIWCRHLLRSADGPTRCRAFPEGIPDAIQMGLDDHLDQRIDLGQNAANTIAFEPIADIDKWQSAGTLPPWDEREPAEA